MFCSLLVMWLFDINRKSRIYKINLFILSPSIKSPDYRVSIRKTFAQFLRNETQNFSFFAQTFCAKKNNNLRNHSQKSFRAKIALFRFCETQVLRNSATRDLRKSAIPQFRKNQTVGDGVYFLEFNSGKILFWNVFLLVTFT